MKNFLSLLFLGMIFVFVSQSQANNSLDDAWNNLKKGYKENITWAHGEKVFLDVKVKFAEVTTLTPAKNGTVLFLTQTTDLGLRETREDYSLWLKHYSSRQKQRLVFIEYDVELRSPGMIREGRLLASRRVHLDYSLDAKIEGEQSNHELTLEMYYCGMETVRVARELIKEVRE